MEPAVKPAAQATRSRSVGVLATPATFQGKLFASVVERFAQGVELVEVVLPGLVEQIEAGDLDGPTTRRILKQGLAPLRSRGVDTLVLACTHYPFVIPLIRELAGDGVEVIDPSPAIARQAGRLLADAGLAAAVGPPGRAILYSTADSEVLGNAAWDLIGLRGEPRSLRWRGDELGP
jgi:glutamate racemase